MFCHKCGAQIAEGAAFCHKRGTKVVYADSFQRPIDATVQTIKSQIETAQEISAVPVQTDTAVNGENDFIAVFGEPETQSEYSIEYGEGFREDGWMGFYLDDADQVNIFSADPVHFTFEGQSLVQDFDTLVTTITTAIDEDADTSAAPSSTGGDYSPAHPWDAPGMSASDFI